MNNLPIEVLYNIFDLLCLTQKRECMFVCKHWSYVISTRNLLKTVYISDSYSFDQFLERLKQEPVLALQVESLTLIRCLAANFDRRHFITYFPNLKEISISPIQGLFLNSRKFYHFSETQFHTLSKSADQLQYVEDTDECELTRYLIKNKLCSHLTTLKLHLSDEEYDSKSNSCMFSVLKDMPVLKNLILESPLLVKIDMLETIHNNIPLLESLEMSNAVLLPSLLPANIKPATLVNRLKINILDSGSDGRTEWLNYIQQKYTHLKYFNLNFGESLKDEGWVKVYSERYPRILQSLGSRLESLVLLGELDMNSGVIQNLDRYGCKLKELELFGCDDLDIFLDLFQTKQSNLIEKLTLHGLSYDYDFDMLQRMKHLKALSLDFMELDIDYYSLSDQEISQIIESHTACLNTLFEGIPASAESVVIKNGHWEFDASVGDYKNIKSLTFDGISLKQDKDFDEFMFQGTKKVIDRFIHNHFQNLHSLTLIDCFDEWDDIKLPGCRFSYLELTRNTACKDFNVSLTTNEDRKRRTYNAHRLTETGDYGWENMRLPMLSDDVFGKYAVAVTCHSVKKLVVCEVECFLYSDKFEFQSFLK